MVNSVTSFKQLDFVCAECKYDSTVKLFELPFRSTYLFMSFFFYALKKFSLSTFFSFFFFEKQLVNVVVDIRCFQDRFIVISDYLNINLVTSLSELSNFQIYKLKNHFFKNFFQKKIF